MPAITEFFVRPSDSLLSVLDRLQATGKGMVLLVDETGRLVRTVTDGDIRRRLLEGVGLDSAVEDIAPRTPVVAATGTPAARLIELMDERQIDHLPLVDAAGVPVELRLRREIAAPILLSTPHIGDAEMGYVEEAFRTNWIAPLGPNVDAFEQELADEVGVPHAAAVSSGTAAIHLALRLLDVGPGDEVFCSSLTFVASANPILYQGATPVFIDSSPDTWNMSPGALMRALDERAARGRLPKAVIVVSLYGQSADMDPILAACDAHGVPVVEDAAESLGATYRGRQSGSFGRLGIFSFNGNKIITTSGGGMLVSHDTALIERARYLSTQARQPAPHYEHTEVGYNYRMSNILAGIGRGQLQVLGERIASRRRIFDLYRDLLRDVPEVEWMPEAPYGRSNRWLTCATLRSIDRAELIARLAADRIEARPVWKPMHRQPLFVNADYYRHDHDVAGDLFDRGICLPSGSNMTDDQVERVTLAIRVALG